jgi:pentatricopeptide repeat protein
MINRGVQPTKAQCAGIYMRALRSPSTHHLAAKLSRNLRIREARADYHRLGEEIHKGNLPNQVELARFAALCQEHNCLHYYERILERVAITQVEAQKRQLMSKMREGRLPSASELGAFVDTCVQAHQPHLASEVGQWMMRQPPRFKSLWICARVHRLLTSGSSEGARDALIVFSQHYLYDGVPDNLKAYMQALPTASSVRSLPGLEEVLPAVRMDESQSSTPHKPQMLASSHAIALALKAWFTLDPSPENVLDTYRSFISIYYNPHSDGNIPLPMMPDQVSFDIFLTPLAKKGRAEEAMRIMRQALQLGVVPNAHNWDNVIGGFAKAGNSRMVTYILERMEGAGQIQVDSVIDPSSESASQAQDTNTVRPTQDLQKASTLPSPLGSAVSLNGQQQLDGFTFYPPSIVTYATVIRGMCLAGNLKAAQYFVRRMFAAKSPSGERIYRFMENEQAERALKIVSEMERMDKIGARTNAQRVLTSSRQSRPMVDTWSTKGDTSRIGGATM